MSRLKIFAIAALALFHTGAQALVLDVWNSTDPNNYVLLGQITTIDTAQTGAGHYDYYSASSHASGVPLAGDTSNVWVHQDTGTNDLSFGFVFGIDNSGVPAARSSADFRIVGSATNPYVSQSDDPGEAVEIPAGSNAYVGSFFYGNNTDGIMVSGISGPAWTIIVDAVDFGPHIDVWNAVSGDSSHIGLNLGDEIRITPTGNTPSGAPVSAAEPGTMALVLMGLGLAIAGRRRRSRS